MTRKLTFVAGMKRRPVFESWATVDPSAPQKDTHGVCLWGSQVDARLGKEKGEKVCLVRVEVLEVLD